MSPPTTVHVAWCATCGVPTGVATRRDGTGLLTCACGGFTTIERYQRAPSVKRTGRKPRKAR